MGELAFLAYTGFTYYRRLIAPHSPHAMLLFVAVYVSVPSGVSPVNEDNLGTLLALLSRCHYYKHSWYRAVGGAGDNQAWGVGRPVSGRMKGGAEWTYCPHAARPLPPAPSRYCW
jgi:hypothetical protein